MPGFDKTGPVWGGGPQAGWGYGPCGFGRRFGRGFGRGARWFGLRSYDNEADFLKEETKNLEEELKAIKERIEKLEKNNK